MRPLRILTTVLVLALIATSASAQLKSANPNDSLPATPNPKDFLPAGFREVSIARYLLYTDLNDEDLRSVEVRLDRLATEYDSRTREFSEAPSDKQMPFFLFSKKEDYYAAGGTRGSAGIFEGDRLMACLDGKADSRAWSTIQHEAFHQYAAVRLGQLPIWVNEGMAEYFGHGIFTGDGFVCGVIPPWRLARVRAHLAANEFLTLGDMLRYTHEQWNERIESTNYDQAWAYIQFLAHGSGETDRPKLMKYIRDIGRRQDPVKAFRASLGELDEVQRRFTQWVADLPENPTLGLYGEASVATVTSFVARAAACQQVIRSIDELSSVAARRELRCADDDWLPVQMLQELLPFASQLGSWNINPGSRKQPPAVVLRLRNGTVIRGMFTLNRGRVVDVRVESQSPAITSPSRRSR